MASQKLRVGIVGAGEVAQVVQLPTLSLLSHLYTVVAIADISPSAVKYCSEKYNVPAVSNVHALLDRHAELDVVFILTSDEFHAEYAVLALEKGLSVMIEKPISLSLQSTQRIIEAEKKSKGRVFVGYMRRYAPSFTECFLKEVRSLPRIKHVHVRDIVGPNSFFVGQSGTDSRKFTDFPPNASHERDTRLEKLYAEAFPEQEITKEKIAICRFLGSLGSHDLSLMREAIGSPDSVVGVTCNEPFYSAIFANTCQRSGEKFATVYESGIDTVPRFDASLTVFGEEKTVAIFYQSPYVKALPIEVKITEKDASGGRSERTVLASYEDAYTVELREMHKALVSGSEIKTSAADALNELKLYDMMFKTAFGQ